MTSERAILRVDFEEARFQVRAAAILRREGHILLHRAVGEEFWALPGGRVELGEPSVGALEREILEEMSVPIKVGRLHYVVENFFTLGTRRYHEFGFYFDTALEDPFPFAKDGEICFRSRDGGTDLEFAWVRDTEAALDTWNFKPPALRPRLHQVDSGFEHLVLEESYPELPLFEGIDDGG